MHNDRFQELSSLFFETRQIIRSKLPAEGSHDPNAWMRSETLRFISQLESPTMQDVAAHLRITAPSATSLIRYLHKQGLLARVGKEGDKRVVCLTLTPAGKTALSAYKERCSSTMRKVFSALSDTEIDELATILRHLRDIHE